MKSGSDIPRWDLDPIYPGFGSEAYLTDKKRLSELISELSLLVRDAEKQKADPENWLNGCIQKINEVSTIEETLGSYAYTRYSTNTTDTECVTELGAIEALSLPLSTITVEFRNALAPLADRLGTLLSKPHLAPYKYFLEKEIFLQGKQMTSEQEDLAADLNRSGGNAWSRLQQVISSTLKVVWDETTGETKTVIELRNLAYSPDEAIRKKAYGLELAAWKTVEIPLAAALNGVKGFSHTLNSRRDWDSTLSKSVFQARISRKALDTMIGVMTDALPVFRSYLTAKAKLLGKKTCAFSDIFAPVGNTHTQWDWNKATTFLVGQFNSFSPELGSFAQMAFDKRWIDAEPREGKVGGAYCIDFPARGETRILSNYDGSFNAVSTLAHELGHAYHGHVMKDMPPTLAHYPMTLAETASIFCETIVFNGAITTLPEDEKLGILEHFLQDTTQVIVDILSRFLFEKNVMEIRKDRELSPEEFSSLMIDAQKATYGEGLDPEFLHPWMWAVKGHYYSPELAFYNFPYAFGQLFGLGLYNLFQKEGSAFPARYNAMLRKTGSMDAVPLLLEMGFNIEEPGFWQGGIAVIEARAREFAALVEKRKG